MRYFRNIRYEKFVLGYLAIETIDEDLDGRCYKLKDGAFEMLRNAGEITRQYEGDEFYEGWIHNNCLEFSEVIRPVCVRCGGVKVDGVSGPGTLYTLEGQKKVCDCLSEQPSNMDGVHFSARMCKVLCLFFDSEKLYNIYSDIAKDATVEEDRVFDAEVKELEAYFLSRRKART